MSGLESIGLMIMDGQDPDIVADTDPFRSDGITHLHCGAIFLGGFDGEPFARLSMTIPGDTLALYMSLTVTALRNLAGQMTKIADVFEQQAQDDANAALQKAAKS